MRTEGDVYQLENTYLTQDEKVDVEIWFQWPGVIMEYAFWAMAILSISYSFPMWYVVTIPIVINLIVGVINWNVYNMKILRPLGLSLFHNYVTALIGVGVAIYLFTNGAWFLAGVSAFIGIFSFLFFELHIILYSFLAQKYKMHPKYVFAKKRFGRSFPFEERKEHDI